MATYYGIDVSQHQMNVYYTKVKKEKSFVMIRAGYGMYSSQVDPYFEQNYKNAKAAGLNVGTYWYSYAQNAAEAKAEAELFINTIKGKQFEMPIAFDIEDPTQDSLSTATKDAIITTFMSYCESKGYYVMLYSYDSFLKNSISASVRKKYDVWCANTAGSPSVDCGIHQYSFVGKVSGVSGNCDLDKTTTDYPSLIKKGGFNGFTKTTTTTTTKTTTTSTTTKTATSSTAKTTTTTKTLSVLDATGMKKGESNNGTLALKKLLLLAIRKKLITGNVDSTATIGGGTVNAINAFLKKWGYKQNGIAGTKFIAKLYTELSK